MELELGTDAASFKNLLVFLTSGFGGGTGERTTQAERCALLSAVLGGPRAAAFTAQLPLANGSNANGSCSAPLLWGCVRPARLLVPGSVAIPASGPPGMSSGKPLI